MKFYKETEFQETPIGKIPKEWEVVKLNDKKLAEIIMGQSPSSSTYNKEGKGLPFLQGKMEFGEVYPSPTLYCSQPIKIAEKDDILISVRAPVGDVNIAPYRLCIGRGLAAIRFNLKRANHWFYFYYFQKIKNFLENLGKGSTFKAITKEDLENLKVPYPSFFEQQKIAEILSTIDRTIEDVNTAVARLKNLKKALMNELLTGRVRVKEENGKLVFHGETEFQETEIGEIPKEWKITKIKDVAEIRGSKKLSEDIDKVVFISMEAIPDDKIYTSFEVRNSADVKSYVYCEPGDILLAKITPSFENGKQGIVSSDIPGNFALATTEVYPIKCKHIDTLYLFYMLKYSPNRNKLASLMRGTTGRRRVPRDALEKLIIPFPPINEQKKIADILLTVDRAIELYYKEKDMLKNLKTGLMDMLLTGKVRVRED
jgi:type I restriction enzyme S subunit